MSENYYKELAKFQKDNGVKTDENLFEKYATKTYIDKDYKDIVVSEKSFVNLVQENKKQKEILDKIKEIPLKHIDNANEELQIILGSNNDLEYKNQCSHDFEIIRQNVELIYNEILDYLEGKK